MDAHGRVDELHRRDLLQYSEIEAEEIEADVDLEEYSEASDSEIEEESDEEDGLDFEDA